MSEKKHSYRVVVTWTGNNGSGTANYRAYARNHTIAAAEGGKPQIMGSSDPSFRGDSTRWNPEELFVATLSACHKLFYLHFCADAGITVTEYVDCAEGEMVEAESGSGRFTRVTLRPAVTIAHGGDAAAALQLHDKAHAFCFIANSVSFPVFHEPRIRITSPAPETEESIIG